MSFNDLEQGLGGSGGAGNGRGSRQNTPLLSGTITYFFIFQYYLLTKLFLDDDREYKTLTQRVSQQVFHINGNISSIERLVGYLGGSRDTPDTRTKLYVIVFSDSTIELILSFPQP